MQKVLLSLKKIIFLSFLSISASIGSLYAQNDELFNAVLDAEEGEESAYAKFMEYTLDHITDTELRNDTSHNLRLRQQLSINANRCLSSQAGYIDPTEERKAESKAYLGNPWNQTIRYRLTVNKHLSAGLTLDKDAGERFHHHLPYYDSYGIFASYKSNSGWLRNAVIGHYRLRLGSGLVINQIPNMGKNIAFDSFTKQGIQLSPSASTTNDALQGAASEMRFGTYAQWRVLAFASCRMIDGTLRHKASNDEPYISALHNDGYHRTLKEEAYRNRLCMSVFGMHIGNRGQWYEIGLNTAYTMFNLDYIRNTQTYNKNFFRGHKLAQISVDYHAMLWGFEMRGETALSDNGGLATIAAIQRPILDDTWVITMLYRYFDSRYQQLHASVPSESSSMQNERGCSFLIQGQPFRHWRSTLRADYFHFTAPQYHIDHPIRGWEANADIRYERRRWSESIQYKLKHKEDNQSPYFRHTLSNRLQYQISRFYYSRLQLNARLYSSQIVTSQGYSASLALGCKGDHCPISAEIQASAFKTDDYDTRIYISERQLSYSYSFPMLYGQGVRYTIYSALKIGPCRIEAKYAIANYAKRKSLSSGLQQINDNTRHDLWLACRVKMYHFKNRKFRN